MQKLNKDFYCGNDVTEIARALLGKMIITKFDSITTAARIVETEAYAGIVDKASHAYAGRRTARTEVMFGEGGTAYVYLCYGIHQMFNVVTNEKEKPDAVLIRGIEPVTGIDEMLKRSRKKQFDNTIGRGPGNVGKALGIFTEHTGMSLLSNLFFIADDDFSHFPVMAGKRIGVDYAGAHAKWLYRFFIKDHKHVTKHAFNKEAIELL